MENITEFKNRVYGFSSHSLPEYGNFTTNPSLENKVDNNGKMKSFKGNTIIFDLDRQTKKQLSAIQKALHEMFPHMLAERISPASFHITLHDLLNGEPSDELNNKISICDKLCHELLITANAAFPNSIRLRSTFLFNMVNTSLVMGFEPINEDSCFNLMSLYEHFNRAVPLDYPLTPHVTLAYYKPGTYSSEDLTSLNEFIGRANRLPKIECTLPMKSLSLSHFSDMNTYFAL